MSTRWMAIILFGLLVVVTVPMLSALLRGEPPTPTPVQTLVLPENRTIRITALPVLGQRVGLYYETEPAGSPEEEPAFFGSLSLTDAPPEFVVHTAEDGELVAVALADRPTEVLILHDFAAGESWPRHDWETVEGLQARGEALLGRLQAAHEATRFTLVPAEGLRPLRVGPDTSPGE